MFLWTSQRRLIQRKHWIFQPSPHSHQAVDLFFSSSWWFFKHVTYVPFPSPNRQALHVGHSPGWHQLCFLIFLVVFSKDYKAGVIHLYVLQMFSAAGGWRVLARQPGKLAWLLPELYLFCRNLFFAAMNLKILFPLALCCVSFFLKNMTLAEFPWYLG